MTRTPEQWDALEKGRLGRHANTAATERLREKYSDEFAAMLAEERLARGLPAERSSDVVANLRAKVAELERKLAGVGGEPT